MKILISNSNNIPIYQQIKDTFINQILSNELEENEMLPSIRSLALDIRISVMTIKKAYDELEQEGYIKTVHGKGSFVAPKNTEMVKEQANKDIESHMKRIIEIAEKFSIKKEDIIDAFNIMYEEDK